MQDASAGLGMDRWRVIVGDRLPIFSEGLRTLAAQTQDISVVATALTTDLLIEAVNNHTAHVVILDAGLPPDGGLGALRALLGQELRTPVLMLSSPEETHGAPRALSEGAAGLLSKSCSPGELFSAIRSIAAGDVVLGPAAAAALVHRNGYADLQLTETEVMLLDLFMAGDTQPEIAKKLLMSESTLKRKFNEVQRKLGARTRVEAVARAARIGLV